MVEARDFNAIVDLGNGWLRKTSSKSLLGEIHWYKNAPKEVEALFPEMGAFDGGSEGEGKWRWYELRKVEPKLEITHFFKRGGPETGPLLGAVLDA